MTIARRKRRVDGSLAKSLPLGVPISHHHSSDVPVQMPIHVPEWTGVRGNVVPCFIKNTDYEWF